MTKTTKVLIVIGLLLAVVLASAVLLTPKKQYNTVVFRSGTGWGYGIYKKEHLYILQPYLPCFANKIPFHTKAEAKRVGRCVEKKLSRNEKPILTKKEVTDLLN